MAATMTVTAKKNPYLDGAVPLTIVIDWVSHSDGTVSLPIASGYTAQVASSSANPPYASKVQGVLKSCQTIPGLNGDKTTLCPTAYDLTILDAYGDDILMGNCAGRSASVSDKVLFANKQVVDSELTVTIANAGDGKKGRIILEFDALEYFMS